MRELSPIVVCEPLSPIVRPDCAADFVKQGKHPIGVGAFGVVWCVKHHKTFERYALKIISKSKALAKGYTETELQELVANEIKVLQLPALRDQAGLMPLLSYFSDSDKHYMKFPLCGGDLYSLLAKFGPQDETSARYVAACVIQGLEAMHLGRVAHRDTKPENVMVGRDGKIYLSDFGTARELPSPDSKDQMLHDMAGTLMYVAPEVVRWSAERQSLEVEPAGHDHRVDCWGLGVVLYLMLVGKLPFHAGDDADEQTLALIKAADLHFPSNVKLTKEVQDLLHRMLQPKPADRPSMTVLKKHKWFRAFQWTTLAADKLKPPKQLQQQANKLWAEVDFNSRNKAK